MTAASPLITRRIRLGPGVIALVLTIMVVLPAIMLLAHALDSASGIPAGAWITIVVVELVLVAALASWHRVEIDDDRIRLRWFPLYDRTLPIDELTGFEPVVVRFSEHGVGLRLLGGGGLGLTNRSGPGVRLEFTHGRSYVIALADDGEVDAVLSAVALRR